jgi:hypothetical protein
MRRRELWAAAATLLFAGCDRLGWKQEGKQNAGEPELQVAYSLILDGNPTKRISEKYQFRSGDRFRVEIRPASRAFVYLLNRGTRQNECWLLYPNRNVEPGKALSAGQTITLPGGQDWYTLDQNAGAENLVLIASAESLVEFAASDTPIPQEECERKIAALERERRPQSFKRVEDHDWVRLVGSGNDKAVMVTRLPVAHR